MDYIEMYICDIDKYIRKNGSNMVGRFDIS